MECSYGVAITTKLFIILSFVAFARGLANPETDPHYSDALDVAVAYLKSNPLILNDGGDPYIYIQVPVDNHGNNGRQPQPVIDIHLPQQLLEEIQNSQIQEESVNKGSYIDIQVPSELFVDIQAPYTHPGYNFDYQQNLYVPKLNPYIQQQNQFSQQQYTYGQPQNSYVHQEPQYIHQETPYVQQENPYVHQENPYFHQETLYIHQDNHYVHQENPYVHQEQPYVHEESPYIYEDVPYVPYIDEAARQKQAKPYIDIEYTIRVQADDLQAVSDVYSLQSAENFLPVASSSEEYSIPSKEHSLESEEYSFSAAAASKEYSIPADPMLAYIHAQKLLSENHNIKG